MTGVQTCALPISIKAMARKLAEYYWRIMVKGLDYAELGVKQYEEQMLIQKQKVVQRLANELNLQISQYKPVT